MQGMRNSFRYDKNYQHRTWFDRVIQKIKRVQFFLPRRVFILVDDVRRREYCDHFVAKSVGVREVCMLT